MGESLKISGETQLFTTSTAAKSSRLELFVVSRSCDSQLLVKTALRWSTRGKLQNKDYKQKGCQVDKEVKGLLASKSLRKTTQNRGHVL